MTLAVEGIVDDSVHAEEALGGSGGFEALHFVLSSPHHLIRFSARLFFRSPCSSGHFSRSSRKAEA